MAMTKKEREAFDEALREARILGALRWTQDVKPDVPPPSHMNHGLTKGFVYVGTMSDRPRVEIACSSSLYHSVGRHDKTTTQKPRNLFSTRVMALRALRHQVELTSAEKLARIDKDIADAIESILERVES